MRARANHSGRGSTPRAITNSRPLSAEIDGDGREKFFSFRISRVGKFVEGRGGREGGGEGRQRGYSEFGDEIPRPMQIRDPMDASDG